MGWILLLTFVVTLAAGVYIILYEPERFVAEYTFSAFREDYSGKTPAPLSMWMLLRDYNRLLDDDDFRQQVVAEHKSDGKTFISARGSAADHMVTIRAVGQDPMIVCGLADAVGDRLVAESESLLGVVAARKISQARLLPQPDDKEDYIRIFKVMLITFGVLSLMAILFGSRREPVGWMTPPVQLDMPVIGQVPECSSACEDCARKLKRKKLEDGRLLTHVNRLVREEVEESALTLRSTCNLESSSIAIVGIRAEDDGAAYAVLLGETLAADGYSVLMMEMDGDAPKLRHYLGVMGQVDVVDCLADDQRLPMAILRTAAANLHLIDCCHDGETLRQTAASPAFRCFVKDALAVYDYVILHAPPASFGSGAAAVGAAADQTVLVAHEQRYTAKELAAVASGLRQRAARISGVLFTGVKERQLKAIYQEDGKAYRKQHKHAARM